MKPTTTLSCLVLAFFLAGSFQTIRAQQYKLKQTTSMMGMKSESTIYVKGMRKRTEGGGFAGMPANNIVTIQQCDLQRNVLINDKKKLYFIEPFTQDAVEVIEENAKPAAKTKPTTNVTTKEGGTIHMWYNITDTGERKKMYGFTARHVWTTQKIKPSADACSMKDSLVMKTDGWYIDLPEFKCPLKPMGDFGGSSQYQKPDCKDRYVSHNSGKGKLGFPLIETRTIIMGGNTQSSEYKTDIETLELATGKLDSMLFEIPPGYTQTRNQADLQDAFDPKAIANQYIEKYKEQYEQKAATEEKRTGVIRIGVYEPKGETSLQPVTLQAHMVSNLHNGMIEAIAINSPADAEKYKCDYLLNTEFVKVKQASKVGGLLKAIKNTDPSAATSFNIDANLVLTSRADGSVRSQQSVTGKFDGQADEAAKRALEKGCNQVMKDLGR